MAPRVLADLKKGKEKYSRQLLKQFQTASDLSPVDGIYGPRTAGALRYYIAETGKSPPETPQPFTTDKRIIPYAI